MPNPGIYAKLIASTPNALYRESLLTFELRLPRCILAELNTHTSLAKNAGSSRAKPINRIVEQVLDAPFIPVFRTNQKGMQAGEALDLRADEEATAIWFQARDNAVASARQLADLGVHKQYVNRLLEPWMFTEVVVTGVESMWANLIVQRYHPAAEPSFADLAKKIYESLDSFLPYYTIDGQIWHLPYITPENYATPKLDYSVVSNHLADKLTWSKEVVAEHYPESRHKTRWFQDISAARCARVSYTPFDSETENVLEDVRLAVQLTSANPGHWSPFEHVARVVMTAPGIGPDRHRPGKFGYAFEQYRKEFPNECTTSLSQFSPPEI